MIELQRLNGDYFMLNALLIEEVEAFPDTTTITLVSGKKVVVSTEQAEIVKKMTSYYQRIGLAGQKISR